MEIVRALGDTPALAALPGNRLLRDLLAAADRSRTELEPLAGPVLGAANLAAGWYRDVQAAWLRARGKDRTVEFSGLSVLRLCQLFPTAQFVVVRQLRRAVPRSQRFPVTGRERILEIDSDRVADPETLRRVLAFLGEGVEQIVLDLSDGSIVAASSGGPRTSRGG